MADRRAKKVGFYLVSTSKNEILINHVTIDEKGNLIWFAGKNEILVWCPLSEIEPYKEKDGTSRFK